MNIDRLWETYHHIAKLYELGADERGNTWDQASYGHPVEGFSGLNESESVKEYRHTFEQPDNLCGTGQCFAGWYATLAGVSLNGCGEVKDPATGAAMMVPAWVDRDAGINGGANVDAPGTYLYSPLNRLENIREALIKLTGEDRS